MRDRTINSPTLASPRALAGRTILHLVVSFFVSCCISSAAAGVSPQGQPPLTLEQIKKLVSIKAPDGAVAREIQQRGLAFTPSRETFSQMQTAGAGVATLSALNEFLPMLDEAKREIPRLLQVVYPALDQGNPNAARSSISADLFSNPSKLDRICKPFSYRAHYIEAIIERPQRHFEALVHVLSKPMEERVYVLSFGIAGSKFQLAEVRDPDNEWFQNRITEAEQLVRKFIYAANAQRSDVEEQCVSPSLVRYLGSSRALKQIQSAPIVGVGSNEPTRVTYYKGLKIRANFVIRRERTAGEVYTFLLDRINDQEKIVAWTQGEGQEGYNPEDFRLEFATLQRFGISAPPPNEPAPDQEVANTPAASPVPQKETLTFVFRHQHINLLGPGNAIYYCWGNLVVAPDGTIRYDCTGTNDPQGRCDHVVFPSGRLDEAKIRMDGGLHLAGKGLGKYDFYGSGAASREALAAVAPLVKR